jgi:DNA-binding winged helix-turn-helix (wHTH) protein
LARLRLGEFEILRYLAERANMVVHRDELLREVWGYPDDALSRSADKAILRLRRKIEPDPHRPTFIHTAHGDGYCLTVGANEGSRAKTNIVRCQRELIGARQHKASPCGKLET